MAEKKPAPPTSPDLIGEKLYLRPATAEDIANTHHWWLQSKTDSQAAPEPLVAAAEAAEAYRKQERSINRQEFVAIRQADNLLVARAGYAQFNAHNRSAEIRVLVDPEVRRKGVGAEALRILAGYLFGRLGLNKVWMQCSANNTEALALAEGLGFRRDATLRHHYVHGQEFVDGCIYSLLRHEWSPARRSGLF